MSDAHCPTCSCEGEKKSNTDLAIVIEKNAIDTYMSDVDWHHVVEVIKANGDIHEYHTLLEVNDPGERWDVECDECEEGATKI